VTAVLLVCGGGLWGAWSALVGQLDAQDVVAGVIAAGAGLLLGWLVSDRGRAIPQLRWADVRTLIALGPKMVTESVAVFAATWDRVRRRGSPSRTRTVRTDVRGGGWQAARRSGVVAALLSATPATVVVDIDADSGEATVHEFGHGRDGQRPTR
jgi:multisubunit Na+/H+ antiporter MnhE subunit